MHLTPALSNSLRPHSSSAYRPTSPQLPTTTWPTASLPSFRKIKLNKIKLVELLHWDQAYISIRKYVPGFINNCLRGVIITWLGLIKNMVLV